MILSLLSFPDQAACSLSKFTPYRGTPPSTHLELAVLLADGGSGSGSGNLCTLNPKPFAYLARLLLAAPVVGQMATVCCKEAGELEQHAALAALAARSSCIAQWPGPRHGYIASALPKPANKVQYVYYTVADQFSRRC